MVHCNCLFPQYPDIRLMKPGRQARLMPTGSCLNLCEIAPFSDTDKVNHMKNTWPSELNALLSGPLPSFNLISPSPQPTNSLHIAKPTHRIVLATVAFLLLLDASWLSQAGITHYSQLLTLQHSTKLLLFFFKVDLSLSSKFQPPHEGFCQATS